MEPLASVVTAVDSGASANSAVVVDSELVVAFLIWTLLSTTFLALTLLALDRAAEATIREAVTCVYFIMYVLSNYWDYWNILSYYFLLFWVFCTSSSLLKVMLNKIILKLFTYLYIN